MKCGMPILKYKWMYSIKLITELLDCILECLFLTLSSILVQDGV